MDTWKALLITVIVALIIFLVAGPMVLQLPGVFRFLGLVAYAAIVIGLYEYLKKRRVR